MLGTEWYEKLSLWSDWYQANKPFTFRGVKGSMLSSPLGRPEIEISIPSAVPIPKLSNLSPTCKVGKVKDGTAGVSMATIDPFPPFFASILGAL